MTAAEPDTRSTRGASAPDRSARRERLLDALAEDVDGLVLTNPHSIRWLTGFSGSAGLVAATRTSTLLVTDGRYDAQAHEQSGAAAEVIITGDRAGAVTEFLGSASIVGLEADHVTWSEQRTIADEWFPAAELRPLDALVLELRTVKDDAEIRRIHDAAEITDAALRCTLERGLEGRTEIEIALAIETEMRLGGADGAGYDLIVASGPNSARPHHRPSLRSIASGDLVVIDIGAEVDGYRSDMTRTYSVGTPSDRARQLLDAVREAQQLGVEAVSAGVGAAAIDQACRRHLETLGLADGFVHGTGHGVGLEIHEPPWIGRRSEETLVAGNVITVEPGVYFADFGGVRVEDTVVVGSDGARRLTAAPKVDEL